VSAPDDGLIGIVSDQVEAAPGENPGEDVAWSRDTLSSGATNGYRKSMFHSDTSYRGR
jgi:hypothetical protein